MGKAKVIQFPSKLPFDPDAEQSVLGGILLDNSKYVEVSAFLGDKDFFIPEHGLAYQALSAIIERQEPADAVTLKDTMCAVGFDSMRAAQLVAEVTVKVPEPGNVVYYAKIVRRKALLRKAIDTIEKAREEAYSESGDPEAAVTILGELSYDFDRLCEQVRLAPSTTKVENIGAAIAEIESGQNAGLPTGFSLLDRNFGGLVPGELTVIAGRTSQGKTALGCNIAFNMARAGSGSCYFTLEMDQKQLWSRLLALTSGVDTFSARRRGFDQNGRAAIEQARLDLIRLPMEVHHEVSLTPRSIARHIARIRKEIPLKAIFVDYLGLLHGDGQKAFKQRHEEMGSVVRDLREIAGKYELALVLLCQLNREVEDDKKPKLSQLRDTGVAEEHAGNVLLVYKPMPEKGTYQTHFMDPNQVRVTIEKQRCGPAPIDIDMFFDRTIGQFREMPEEPF